MGGCSQGRVCSLYIVVEVPTDMRVWPLMVLEGWGKPLQAGDQILAWNFEESENQNVNLTTQIILNVYLSG